MSKWEFDPVAMVEHALKLSAEDKLELLAAILDADRPEDMGPLELSEEDDLFNETRLYEALGKEDARTVLAHHHSRDMARAMAAILTGRKVVLDRWYKSRFMDRVKGALRSVEHNETEERLEKRRWEEGIELHTKGFSEEKKILMADLITEFVEWVLKKKVKYHYDHKAIVGKFLKANHKGFSMNHYDELSFLKALKVDERFRTWQHAAFAQERAAAGGS